jgi:hypothetical protein
MERWTEVLVSPWREIPVVMRSVAQQLLSTTVPMDGLTGDLAARVVALEAQVADRLAQAETTLQRELDAVRVMTETIERRLAALESAVRDGVALGEDADGLRPSGRSSEAFRDALTRAGELAAQRGLTRTAESAIVFGERGGKTPAESTRPAPRSRKTPRGRHSRA